MNNFLKVTSSIALIAICSACSENEPSSSVQIDTSASSQVATEKAPADISDVKEVAPRESVTSETRSAESHTHGDASLGVVLEGSTINVELETPLYNVLGFEHAAETDAQKAAVAKAESVLSDGSRLFVFNREAKCSLSSPKASLDLGLDDQDHHKDKHDDHEGEGHDETHKDVTVEYAYECQSPRELKTITVALFEHFENLSEIDLVYLGPNTQKQAELTASNSRFDLTR